MLVQAHSMLRLGGLCFLAVRPSRCCPLNNIRRRHTAASVPLCEQFTLHDHGTYEGTHGRRWLPSAGGTVEAWREDGILAIPKENTAARERLF